MHLRHLLEQGSRLIGTTTLLVGLAAAPASIALAQPYGLGRPHNNAAAFAPPAYQPPQYMAQGQYTAQPQYAAQPYAQQMQYAPQQVAMRPGHHHQHQPNYCPPGYQPGYAPQSPGAMQQPTPASPNTAQPGTDMRQQTPGSTGTTTTPNDNQQNQAQNPQQNQAQNPQQNQAQNQQQNQAQNQSMNDQFANDSPSGSRASLSPGADTPQLGRNDAINRLNLFDNMTAAPQTRAWYGFQYSDAFNTGLQLGSGVAALASAYQGVTVNDILEFNEGITTDFFVANQTLHRVGGEYAINENCSVSVQGQYVATLAEEDPSGVWTNPQILLKHVVYRDCNSVFTGTLGLTPETSNDIGDINEGTTKFYPGMLFYESVTQNFFVQGGAQVGLPIDDNEITHADWSMSFGYWLFRDCHPCSRGHCHQPHFLRTLHIRGIIPQINVLGKHVLGDRTITGPFGFRHVATDAVIGFDQVLVQPPGGFPVLVDVPIIVPASLPEGFVVYKEQERTIDITAGTTVLVGDRVQIGLGYSIPTTAKAVRDHEVIMSYNFLF